MRRCWDARAWAQDRPDKVVPKDGAQLAHASAVITLDTYGHLWPDDDTLTRTVIDAAFGPLEDSLRTRATLWLLRCR